MIAAEDCTPISWMRLERHALGELAAGEITEIVRHLDGCPRCRACAEQISADAARELAPLPPLPANAPATGPVIPLLPARRGWPSWRRPPTWPKRRFGWRQAFAAAAVTLSAGAVAIVAVTVRPHEPRAPHSGGHMVAVKGGDIAVELVRERDASVAWDPTSFAPGDRFKLLLTCAPPLQVHADLVVLQDDGAAFPGAPSLIACGNRVPVPPAFRITGPGAATVCVALDPSAPPLRAALAAGDTAAAGAHACLRLERSE